MPRANPVGIIDLQKSIKTVKEKYRQAIQCWNCEIAAQQPLYRNLIHRKH